MTDKDSLRTSYMCVVLRKQVVLYGKEDIMACIKQKDVKCIVLSAIVTTEKTKYCHEGLTR